MFETVLGKLKRLSLSLRMRRETSGGVGKRSLRLHTRMDGGFPDEKISEAFSPCPWPRVLTSRGNGPHSLSPRIPLPPGPSSLLAHPTLSQTTGEPIEVTPFPRLKHLIIGRMMCVEDELIALPKLNRHTLKELYLSDITLLDNPESASSVRR